MISMAGFKCPFCGEFMSMSPMTTSTHCFDFNGEIHPSYVGHRHCLAFTIYRCPNESCGEETLIARGINGYIDERTVMIYPEAIYRHFPDYVPEGIRADYEEACLIRERSPKASATLARRCVQGMIRDFWKIEGERNLYYEIDAIRDKVPAAQWAAIDAIRQIGNIGAHMERDVNLIVDVEPEEAGELLQLIELLIEKWYISRNDEELLYKRVTELAEIKKAAKHPE